MDNTNITEITSDLTVEFDKDCLDGLPVAVEIHGRTEWLTIPEAKALVAAVNGYLSEHGGVENSLAPSQPTLEERVAKLEAKVFATDDGLDRLVDYLKAEPAKAPTSEEVIANSIIDGTEVTFMYQGIFDPAARRRYVEPSEINTEQDFVFGLDMDANEPRRFKLSRIEGEVEYA